MSEVTKRCRLPEWKREQIIKGQGGRCYYCGEFLIDPLYQRGKLVRKQIHFDHQEAFSYGGNDTPNNIVAACSVCNLIKSDHLFKTYEECVSYIKQQRRAKGYSTERPKHLVSELRQAI